MPTPDPISVSPASTEQELAEVAILFGEYARWLAVDLSFQSFQDELQSLPGRYATPDGDLLLARVGPAIAGCAAFRRWDTTGCEMKRLYVRESFRGRKVGRRLAEQIVQTARARGYRHMLLDTLAPMTTAIGLYESLGFRQVAPYYNNPLEGAVFFRKDLQT